MTSSLAEQRCIPCQVGGPPLAPAEVAILRKQIPEWETDDSFLSLKRKFVFVDFKNALSFVDKIGAVAESEGHHPDIQLGWGYVHITLYTHEVGGLSQNDFILASKIDQIPYRDR